MSHTLYDSVKEWMTQDGGSPASDTISMTWGRIQDCISDLEAAGRPTDVHSISVDDVMWLAERDGTGSWHSREGARRLLEWVRWCTGGAGEISKGFARIGNRVYLPTDMERSVDLWCDALVRSGRSRKTVRTYRGFLRNALCTLHEEGMETDPHRIGKAELGYILAADGIGSKKANALGSWAQWCLTGSEDALRPRRWAEYTDAMIRAIPSIDAWLKGNSRLSSKTAYAYRASILSAVRMLDEAGRLTDLREIGADDIAWLDGTGGFHSRIGTIRAWCAWCAESWSAEEARSSSASEPSASGKGVKAVDPRLEGWVTYLEGTECPPAKVSRMRQDLSSALSKLDRVGLEVDPSRMDDAEFSYIATCCSPAYADRLLDALASWIEWSEGDTGVSGRDGEDGSDTADGRGPVLRGAVRPRLHDDRGGPRDRDRVREG